MMRPPITVEITVHVHNGVPVSVCPDPCAGLQPGDTVVWKKCEENDPHPVLIHGFKVSATGAANNPMEDHEYHLRDKPVKGKVKNGAQKNTYKYTVEVTDRASLVECANEYIRKHAATGAQPAEHHQVHGAAGVAVSTLEPRLASLFGSEDALVDFVRRMAASLESGVLDPEVQIGG